VKRRHDRDSPQNIALSHRPIGASHDQSANEQARCKRAFFRHFLGGQKVAKAHRWSAVKNKSFSKKIKAADRLLVG